MNHDSAIVVLGDGQVLLDLNDARLSPGQLRAIQAIVGGVIDLFAFQGSGASWHPMCYHYSAEHKKQISLKKRRAKLAYVARSIKVAEPVTALPFAGPPCFLDPELFQYNKEMEGGVFPDQDQVSGWLAEQGCKNTLVLLPGDQWEVGDQIKNPDPFWEGFSLADRWDYLRAYAQRRHPQIEAVLSRHPQPNGSLWEPFRDYFQRLLGMSEYFNRKIGMRVGFDIIGPGGGRWAVEFRPGLEGVLHEMDDCGYVYRFASRWLAPILDGTIPWEDFFLSLRFQTWRDPDVYNEHLLGLLKFALPEALKAVERFETSTDRTEQIAIHAGGRIYRIQRYCPHAGNDFLEYGEVLSGRILRCLAHYYEFDLETGQCLNAACPPLDTKRV